MITYFEARTFMLPIEMREKDVQNTLLNTIPTCIRTRMKVFLCSSKTYKFGYNVLSGWSAEAHQHAFLFKSDVGYY